MYVPRAPDQPRVIVLSGPPCSLKSTIAKSVAKELRISHIAVDDIRKWLMREAGQTPEARSRAYDSMHAIAATLLKGHHSVVLDATYTPIIRRREVERLVLEQGGQLYVIQCRVAADEAALRFRNRPANHPGDDLFEERVAYLATRYPYIAKLPIIDTDKPLGASEDERLRLYLREINGVLLGKPVVPGDWSDIPDPGRANTPHTHGSSNKLSPISRFMANVQFWGSISLVCLAAFFAMVGVFPGARLLWQSWWGQAYGKQELRDAFDWAKVWLALAGGFGAIVPLYRLVEPGIKAAYAILAVGKVPRYGPCQDERPSDISLYDEYLIRSSRSDRSRFALEGVPVYLIVPPTRGRRFDVLMEEHRGRIDDTALTIAAANLGLDWKGFCRWRKPLLSKTGQNCSVVC